MYVCLFVCLSVSLSVCLSPCLSVVDTKKVKCLKEANLNKNKEQALDSCDLIHDKQLELSTTATAVTNLHITVDSIAVLVFVVILVEFDK